jgi:hypothetical protein
LDEAHRASQLAEFFEFLGRNIANDWQVLGAWLQVLAKGQEIALIAPEVGQALEQFIARFSQAQHQSALGSDRWIGSLDIPKQFQGPLIIAFGAADAAVHPRNGLHVVIEDLRCGFDDAVQALAVLDEVGGKDFDRGTGSLADREHALVEMFAAAVGKVIARYRGDDHVFEAESCGGFGDALRLVEFQRIGSTSRHGAKSAWSGANVPHDHEGCGLLRVALHAIGAFGIFAHRLEFQVPKGVPSEVITVPFGNFAAKPGGESATRGEDRRARSARGGIRPVSCRVTACRVTACRVTACRVDDWKGLGGSLSVLEGDDGKSHERGVGAEGMKERGGGSPKPR